MPLDGLRAPSTDPLPTPPIPDSREVPANFAKEGSKFQNMQIHAMKMTSAAMMPSRDDADDHDYRGSLLGIRHQ